MLLSAPAGGDSSVRDFVLVVEDDAPIRESLCEILTAEGFPAIGAENGQQALDYLRSGRRPYLILLDLMMPVMDGATFRAQQQLDPTLSSIPVAIITAAGQQAAAGIEVDAFLAKPLRIESVLNVVEQFRPSA